jgi:diguanylate cyclase (GGDEF)-like protein
MQDVTARKRAESRLQHIAYHDGLTHLPNRSHFLEQLGRVVAAAKRNDNARFAVMFLDFDRFKMVNDSLGHGAGDELLVTVARRLQSCLRPTDLVARLGGDEFAILIENFRSDNEIVDLAERLQRVLRDPIRLCGSDVTTSASIGITTSAFLYDAPEQVMRDADIAMYKAKEQGKARYALFDSALHAEISSQLWMEGELRRAVDNGQIAVDFQPIFDLRTRRLYGFEALARWTHPERGAILPSQFIPMAEETGLIVPLGNQILQLACTNYAHWQRSIPNARALRLHVNVSGVQLSQPGCAARMKQIINGCGVTPDLITLELTESVLIERLSAALPNMLQLRDMGTRISIDDFGTGYSSLSALQDLPIAEIKIDRAFVRRMGDGDGGGVEVVGAIIALGRSMDKRVIAEGIETSAQCERLIGMGCERGQGYLLGRPMAADYAENVARESSPVVRIAYSRPTLVS